MYWFLDQSTNEMIYISFDILAAANGIVKEHLPPFFVNQGPLNIDRFYLESM